MRIGRHSDGFLRFESQRYAFNICNLARCPVSDFKSHLFARFLIAAYAHIETTFYVGQKIGNAATFIIYK